MDASFFVVSDVIQQTDDLRHKGMLSTDEWEEVNLLPYGAAGKIEPLRAQAKSAFKNLSPSLAKASWLEANERQIEAAPAMLFTLDVKDSITIGPS